MMICNTSDRSDKLEHVLITLMAIITFDNIKKIELIHISSKSEKFFHQHTPDNEQIFTLNPDTKSIYKTPHELIFD